jgi:molybdate transport system substrate-binding protein
MALKRRPLLAAAAATAAAALVVGCGGDDDTTSATTTAPGGLSGTITVSAAAAFADAFARIRDDFTAANPGVAVIFNFDSSSILATQITEGAPADVYASADEADMARLTDDDLIAGEPVVFAGNEMVIVTRPGNPAGITALADLADVGVVSLCGENAPCGRYAEQILVGADIAIPESRVTRGQNANATLAAVTDGDAVAAVVYASDAVRAGDAVEAVTIPAEANLTAVHVIGVVASTADRDTAEAFVTYVSGPDARSVLEEFGFSPAP